MKNKILRISGLLVLAGFLSSCYYNPALYPSYSAGVSVSSPSYAPDVTQAWVSATYDSAGFPIYGYTYGRPVYGYTAAGAAIFTLGALTALSCVPDWGYASWYRGSYRYPSHIRRYKAPPRYPKAHRPHYRPSKNVHKKNTTIINNNTVINKNHVNKNNVIRHNSKHNTKYNSVTKNNSIKNTKNYHERNKNTFNKNNQVKHNVQNRPSNNTRPGKVNTSRPNKVNTSRPNRVNTSRPNKGNNPRPRKS